MWAVQTSQRIIPFGYLLHLLVQGHQGCLLEPSALKKLMGQETGSGHTTTVNVQTLLEAFFEHVPEICLFH
jgi:hypothetical protein